MRRLTGAVFILGLEEQQPLPSGLPDFAGFRSGRAAQRRCHLLSLVHRPPRDCHPCAPALPTRECRSTRCPPATSRGTLLEDGIQTEDAVEKCRSAIWQRYEETAVMPEPADYPLSQEMRRT